MKQLVLLVTLALLVASAHAEVFKCKTDDGVTYSETPCAGNAVVSPGSPAPSAEAAQAAHDQMVRDNTYVADSARERAARDARDAKLRRPVVSSVTITIRHTTPVYANGRRAEREEEEEEHERHHAASAGNSGAAASSHASGSPMPTPARTTGIRAANLH